MTPITKKYSHLGFSLTFYLVLSNVLSTIVLFIFFFIYAFIHLFNNPQISPFLLVSQAQVFIRENMFLSTILTSLPGYFIAIPLTILFLNSRKYQDIPLPGFSFETPYEKTMKRKLSVSEYIMYILFLMPLGLIGSSIGAAIASVLSMITGTNITDALSRTISEMQPWQVLITTCIFAPIFEEILFRYAVIGYTRRYGEWNSIFLSALIFGLVHANIFQFFYAFMIGILLGYVYIQTRNLLYTISMHMIFNFFGAFVPVLLSPDGSLNTATIVYTAFQAVVAIVGLVLLVYYIIRGNIVKFDRSKPIPGIGHPDVYLNPGMLCFFLLILLLTIYTTIVSTYGL